MVTLSKVTDSIALCALIKRVPPGVNADACGGIERVCTFKQGIKHYGVPGSAFKGMQKVASLMRMRVTEDKDGKEVKRPTYFAVFDADEMQARARQYKKSAA